MKQISWKCRVLEIKYADDAIIVDALISAQLHSRSTYADFGMKTKEDRTEVPKSAYVEVSW